MISKVKNYLRIFVYALLMTSVGLVSYLPAFNSKAQTADPCYVYLTDISGHKLREHIVNLFCRGDINGYGDNRFGPEDNVTRIQVAKMVVLGLDLPIDTSGNPFPDAYDFVNNDLNQYVQTLKNNATVQGDDGFYYPGRNVTRGEVAKMLVLSMESKGIIFSIDSSFEIFPSDYTTNSFKEYIHKLRSAYVDLDDGVSRIPIMGGYPDGSFKPNDFMTRSQVAKVIDLAYQYYLQSDVYACTNNGGTWLRDSGQCNNVGKSICESLNGTYDSCGSSCGRNSDMACMEICVESCYLSAYIGEEFTIKQGEWIPIMNKSNKTMFKMSFANIVEDSRCAKDVTCVWEGRHISNLDFLFGDAILRLQLSSETGYVDTGNLRINYIDANVDGTILTLRIDELATM